MFAKPSTDHDNNPYAAAPSSRGAVREERVVPQPESHFAAFVAGVVAQLIGVSVFSITVLVHFVYFLTLDTTSGSGPLTSVVIAFGITLFHALVLAIWIWQRRFIYRSSALLAWVLAGGGYLLVVGSLLIFEFARQ